MKCKQFKIAMMKINIEDRPEWFTNAKRMAKSSSIVSSVGSSKKSFRQSTIGEYQCPSMSTAEHEEFAKMLALHYYVTGTSFQRIEQPHFLEALKILRPDVKLPNRKRLAGDLLDKCYTDMKKKIDAQLNSVNSRICITSDAWTNISNDPIINYMAMCNDSSLFLESVATEEQGHSAEWIANDIERVFKTINGITCGACTDNTSANKSAWKILKKKFPTKFFYGCVSHGLHLFVKDIFAATKTKRGHNEATYPDNYPFESLLEFAKSCKAVVKFFHNHHVVKAQLSKEQEARKLPQLIAPAPTRWGTLEGCFKSLLHSENILHSIVSGRDFITGTRQQKEERGILRDIITAENFVSNLKKSIAILEPIDKLIRYFQSDRVPISDVYDAFVKLPEAIHQIPDLSKPEYTYMIMLSETRFKFMYGDAHGVGYLLDPRYIGKGITDYDFKEKLEDFIYTFPPNDTDPTTIERQTEMMQQYTSFVIYATALHTANNFRYQMLVNKSKTVMQFWLTDGNRWPLLQELAIIVFNLVASSAASERNFSTFGFIHSKLRNKLDNKKVEKLVYIKTNYNCFEKEAELSEDEDIFELEATD